MNQQSTINNKYIKNYIIIFLFFLIIILFLYIIFILNKSNKTLEKYNSNIQNKTILINNINRNYKSNINQDDKNVLLCFPGGGETIDKFLSYSGLDKIYSSIIIFEGQESINTYSWQNAFPWLYKNIQNDVLFIDTVLRNTYKNNIPNIFLTGKSDGGGFCVLYSNISTYKKYIKAIGICSSAHFGLTSSSNISQYSENNVIQKNNVIIPKNIILPPNNVSIFIIHGTSDKVMPYEGQHFTNNKACTKNSIWTDIDIDIKSCTNINESNTYTVNFPSYISEIQKTYSNNIISNDNNYYSWNSSISSSNLVFNSISINNQNHDWSGHNDSGPDTNYGPGNSGPGYIYNTYLDATYLLIKFFNLDKGTYIPTIYTIPSNLKTYDNNIIIS
jgi:poly(3-hydroxybutyrate) depolymerase